MSETDWMDKVHILYGPEMKEHHRTSEGVKWCFSCRKRCEFFWIVSAPVEPSYYGPHGRVACSGCDKSDGDLFPGWAREASDE